MIENYTTGGEVCTKARETTLLPNELKSITSNNWKLLDKLRGESESEMQVKMVWIRMNLKFVLKYDRNSVVNISKKQRVAAPWVIINLLSLVSYIFRTRESLIMLICELHSALRLKSHFTRKKHSTETYKTEWSWRYSFRVTHEHEENDTSFKLMRQSPRIFFFEVNELVRPKAY